MAIILAKRSDNPVPDSPGKWLAGEVVAIFEDGHLFGAQEEVSAGNFLHLVVTDKTKAEVETYTQSWDHSTATVTQQSATGDDRLIRIETTMVSASGDGGFDDPDNPGNPAPNFATFLSEINADYPTANATYNAHTQTTYDFDITAPVAARDEIIERALETIQGVQVHRRRWYIPQASRDFIIAQGGSYSATAAQIASGNHLRDGLLD